MTRQKVEPLTFEDVEIRMTVDARFLQLIGPAALPEWPSFSWIISDRRDADLMYRAMEWRWMPELNAIRPEAFAVWSSSHPLFLIDLGGDLSAEWYCDTP
jgi:hypothetical protein